MALPLLPAAHMKPVFHQQPHQLAGLLVGLFAIFAITTFDSGHWQHLLFC